MMRFVGRSRSRLNNTPVIKYNISHMVPRLLFFHQEKNLLSFPVTASSLNYHVIETVASESSHTVSAFLQSHLLVSIHQVLFPSLCLCVHVCSCCQDVNSWPGCLAPSRSSDLQAGGGDDTLQQHPARPVWREAGGGRARQRERVSCLFSCRNNLVFSVRNTGPLN